MPFEREMFEKNFKKKSIQRIDKFTVTIIPQKLSNSIKPTAIEQELLADIQLRAGNMPVIEQYDVVNVTVPNWSFEKETVPQGVFKQTFPVLRHEGFELAILFEDDAYGTMSRFVRWCQARIMDENGLYYPKSISRIGTIVLEAYNDQNEVIYYYSFTDCYFLRATPLTFDYSQPAGQKFSITFGSDQNEYYINQTIVNRKHSGSGGNIGVV